CEGGPLSVSSQARNLSNDRYRGSNRKLTSWRGRDCRRYPSSRKRGITANVAGTAKRVELETVYGVASARAASRPGTVVRDPAAGHAHEVIAVLAVAVRVVALASDSADGDGGHVVDAEPADRFRRLGTLPALVVFLSKRGPSGFSGLRGS